MKSIKKENLPTKICETCNLPFSWRKKWERVWDEVKYCSDGCRKAAKRKEDEANKTLAAQH